MSFMEQYNSSGSQSTKRIAEYLMKQDDLKGLLENENKSLSHMYKWICQQIKKKIGQENEYIAEDQEIFDLAITYYRDEKIIIEQSKVTEKKVITQPTAKLKQTHVKANQKKQLSIFEWLEDE